MASIEEREAAVVASFGSLRGAAARSAGFAGVMTIVVQLLTVVIYIALARLTTPAVFGVFAAGSILLSLGEMFIESGMTAALLQRRDRVDAAAVTTLASTFVGGVLLALVALALSPVVGLFFHSREIGLIAAALSGHLVLNGLTGVPGTLLQRRFALRRWMVEPAMIIAFGAVSGIGLAAGLGAWGLVLGWYASSITRTIGFWLCVQWRPDPRLISWTMWRELARFGRHVLASEMLREAQRVTTTALIGRYLGPSDLGLFRFSWRLVSQATTPVLAANAYTVQPMLVRIIDDPARVRAAVLSIFRLVSVLAFPMGALFIPFGDALAIVLFGEAWRDMGPIMTALAAMGIALAMQSVPSEIFKASGHPEVLPRLHALWFATGASLMIALLPFGALGVAWAWSLSTVFVALYAVSRVPRVVPVRLTEILTAIFPPLVTSLSAAAALYIFNRYVLDAHPEADAATLGTLVLEIVAGAVLYLGGMAVLARGTLIELLHTAASIVRRRRRPHIEAELH